MKQKGLNQEALKLIACVSMLLDHIGAAFVPGYGLRIIGRLAFPIYCFLLTEGMARTRNVKKYGIRLAIGAVLSEIPFDLMFYGRLTLAGQSVMVTLLLGYFMVLWMGRMPKMPLIPMIFCALAAEALGTDYGAMGVAMIALFVLTREQEDILLQIAGLAIICWMIGGGGWRIGRLSVPLQICGVAALVPIRLYNGRKGSTSRALQWAFYLFYPAHLLVLWLIRVIQ